MPKNRSTRRTAASHTPAAPAITKIRALSRMALQSCGVLFGELRRSAGTRRTLARRRPACRADQGQPGRISRVGRTAAVSSSQEPLHPAVPSRLVVLSWYSRLLQPSNGLLSTLRRRPESVRRTVAQAGCSRRSSTGETSGCTACRIAPPFATASPVQPSDDHNRLHVERSQNQRRAPAAAILQRYTKPVPPHEVHTGGRPLPVTPTPNPGDHPANVRPRRGPIVRQSG